MSSAQDECSGVNERQSRSQGVRHCVQKLVETVAAPAHALWDAQRAIMLPLFVTVNVNGCFVFIWVSVVRNKGDVISSFQF